jgi:hypothetical protein
MDFAAFNTLETSEEGSWMTVADFDGEDLDAQILVLGPDSKEVNKIAYEEEKENQKKLADIFSESAKKGKNNKKAEVIEDGPEDRTQKDIDKAVRLTKGWKNIDWLGQELPFNKGNASMLYTNVSMLRNQVLNYYRDLSHFIKPGQPNSKKQSGKDSSLTTQEKKA